jgi:DNA-binding IclR family transcriptional regulator
MPKVSTNARILDALNHFKAGPRTRPELAELMASRQDSVNSWVHLLESKGFIRLRGNRPHPKGSGRQAIEWEYIKEQ